MRGQTVEQSASNVASDYCRSMINYHVNEVISLDSK